MTAYKKERSKFPYRKIREFFVVLEGNAREDKTVYAAVCFCEYLVYNI